MGLEQLTIRELVDAAVRGAYNIPEFQRGFVWRSEQVRDLVDSLYRDYPVGSMLAWDAADYDVPRIAHGAQTALWIIDGQQRTTALCVACGSKPYWWPDADSWNELVEKRDVLANLAADGSVEFALTNPVRRKDPNWVSVRRALRCTNEDEVTALGLAVANERGLPPADPAYARTLSIVRQLWSINNRMLPVVTMQLELEDVAEVFARVNQAGTRVTDADVTVALVAAANPHWIHDEFLS
jgi:hypothetical protein